MKTKIDDFLNERFLILSEECGELIQVSQKIQRFGIEDIKTQDNLVQEIGDVLALISIIAEELEIPADVIQAAYSKKIEKLKKWTKHQK